MPITSRGGSFSPPVSIPDGTTIFQNSGDDSVFGVDANANGLMLASGGNSLGFDSSGNPQINGTFGIPKVVGVGTIDASGLGGVAAGGLAQLMSTAISGLQAGDVILWSINPVIPQTALGAMVLSCQSIYPEPTNTIYFDFINSDPVNPSPAYAGTLYFMVLRSA